MKSGKSRILGFLLLSLTVFGSLHAVINFHYCHGELVSVGVMKDAKKCWGYYEALERAAEEQHEKHLRASCCDDLKIVIESVVECEETTANDEITARECLHQVVFLTKKAIDSSTFHHYKNPLHHRYRHVLFENFRC